jgi:hypothetical protein
MPTYYLEFKTWAEGSIDMPWPMVRFEEVDDYRNRLTLGTPVDQRKLRSTFMSFDEKLIRKFLEDHVPALILGCTMELPNPGEIIIELDRIFGYCEVLGICEVNEQTRDRVAEIMKNAG